MKKRVYLIIYALIQFLFSTYYGIFAQSLAIRSIESIDKMFSMYPVEMQKMMSQLYTVDLIRSSILITAVIGGIMSLILLFIFIKYKVAERKGLTLGLTIFSMLLFGGGIIFVLSVIAIILIAKVQASKSVSEKKEKEKIKRLPVLKHEIKDLILAVLLVLIYLSQFVLDGFTTGLVRTIIIQVVYYVGTFVFALYVFKKRLNRDFKAYKNNVSGYLGYSFKWWGIMLGVSMILGIIRMILGGDTVTANQESLNNLPLWYMAPLAIIFAPFVEELVFRGVIRRFIKNDTLFIVVSALAFGLLHTISAETGLYNIFVQSLQYVGMGAVMAYVYTKTNNIGTNMTIHCIQNTVAVILSMLMF